MHSLYWILTVPKEHSSHSVAEREAHLHAGSQAGKAEGDNAAAARLDVCHLACVLCHSWGTLQQLHSSGDALNTPGNRSFTRPSEAAFL